jgi:hypothetical protein
MDSIIHNIVYYDINKYIILINNLGIFIYNHDLKIILKYNIYNVLKFDYKRYHHIAYISQDNSNIIHIAYNQNDQIQNKDEKNNIDTTLYNLDKKIYTVNPINQFSIFINIVFVSDKNNIYIYKDEEIIDKIPIYINSHFEILQELNIFKLIYQNDSLNIVITEININLTNKKNRNIIPHKSELKKFKLNSDGKFCYTTSIKGTILRIFNTTNCLLKKEFRINYINSIINSINISKNNKWIIINYDNNYIKIFYAFGGTPKANFNSNYLSYFNILESYYSYLYIEDINFKIGFAEGGTPSAYDDNNEEDIFYLATETGKLIKILIKENESEIINIIRFMDNNFNEMIRMNLSFS